MAENTTESLGLQQKDIFTLGTLHYLLEGTSHGQALYLKITDLFQNLSLSRSNFYKSLKAMEQRKVIRRVADSNKKHIFYEISKEGSEEYNSFGPIYQKKFEPIKRVVDLLYGDITGHALKREEKEIMPEEHNLFFSKLISVRDIIKYLILKELLSGDKGTKRRSFYVAEMHQKLLDQFGWQCSQGYIYEVVHEMEEKENFLKGHWVGDSERRSMRRYILTDRGAEPAVFQQIETSTYERVKDVRDFLHSILFIIGN